MAQFLPGGLIYKIKLIGYISDLYKVTAKSYRLDSGWVKRHPHITFKEVEYSRFYNIVKGS